MKFTVEDVCTVKKILHIEIPKEDVTLELDEAYKNLKKRAKIKGFRPGKAPRSVLERFYKKDVNDNVSSKLIQDSCIDAIKEAELKIVGSPIVDPPQLIGNEPYKYDATIEINPEIEKIDFKGLNLKKTAYKVRDEEIEAQLKMLQKNLARKKPIEKDRPVEEGDLLMEFMDWSRCLIVGLQNQKVLSQVYESYLEAGKKRNEYIASKISETLKDDEIGILFMRESLQVQFPSDIQIFYVAPPALDEIKRWLREREMKEDK